MEEKKVVGILSLGNADNYGAVLQSHSLCSYINKKCCKAEIINYYPKFLKGKYPLINVSTDSLAKLIISIAASILNMFGKIKKKNKYKKFRTSSNYYSKKEYTALKDDDYYKYIVGSDQVFNLELTNYDPLFFLTDVVNEDKKNTFAASFGVDKFSEKQKEFLKEKLDSFSNLCVRESEGVNILKHILPYRKVYELLDPVFLTQKSEWQNLLKKQKSEEYILIYTFKAFDLAYKISKTIDPKMRIYCINDDFRIRHNGVYNKNGVGPLDFLELIYNAKYVVTDSFHGTAFSIIFHREFYSIPYKGTESRFKSMLSYFGIEDRLIQNELEVNYVKTIDYQLIDKRIEKNLIDSNNYLLKIIED